MGCVRRQDGSYLAELLLEKGYDVHGLVRHISFPNTPRINHLLGPNSKLPGRLTLHTADLTDSISIHDLLKQTTPDEIYNLGAQSHVAVSFGQPQLTWTVNAAGVEHLLNAVRANNLKDVRFYQASTSEMFGKLTESPQTENSPMHPQSPYSNAKLYAFNAVKMQRSAHNIFACNGILYNHESPRRGENFVTRKITRAVARISLGQQEFIELGNLDAKRDWGHAQDYVEAMWLMLQYDTPGDYIVGMGVSRSVRDFVIAAFNHIGVQLQWEGEETSEVGKDKATGVVRVKINPKFYRTSDDKESKLELVGDTSKAVKLLGWKPRHDFAGLVRDMVTHDIALLK